MLNSLQEQIQTLTEENDILKGLNFSTEDKQNLETQLVVAQPEAFSNLNEKIKIEQELSEANKEIMKLKEATDRTKAVEDEVLLLKNKLQDEREKSKGLDEEKALIAASLRSVQEERDSYASQLKIYEKEIADFRLDIPRIEEEKIMTFKSDLLLARDHVDITQVWDQID